MRILVKSETKTDYIYIPMTESNLQKTCDKFGIANDMKSTVKIEEDYDSSELSKLLNGKDVVLDELNFLAKSLDKYSTNENDIFYVARRALTLFRNKISKRFISIAAKQMRPRQVVLPLYKRF